MRHLKNPENKGFMCFQWICNMLVLEPLACIIAMAFWSLTCARVDAILWQNVARTVHLPGVCNIWFYEPFSWHRILAFGNFSGQELLSMFRIPGILKLYPWQWIKRQRFDGAGGLEGRAQQLASHSQPEKFGMLAQDLLRETNRNELDHG